MWLVNKTKLTHIFKEVGVLMPRKRLITFATAITLGLSVLLVSPPSTAAEQKFITIGTGGVTGVYYPTGGAICRLVNRSRKDHGIRCSVESTLGSSYNVNAIHAGELDFGVVQSDVQYKAYRGEGQFKNMGAYSDLRSVFSLHAESFTVVARTDVKAVKFEDLPGKRVNIGNLGSGQRSTLEQLLEERGESLDVYSLASDLPATEMSSALCDNRIDAMIYVVGHPSDSIKEATSSCQSNLLNVEGSYVDELLKKYPYYRRAVIKGGSYKGNLQDITTFGVSGTVVTSAKTSDQQVYQLVKAVFDNFDVFTRMHPAFLDLVKEEMVSASLTAPLHPGAVKYYREIGLLK